MYSLLLVLIYLSFISLGLPDSLLGSAWPVMHTELNVPISFAGIITMIISICTVISSLSLNTLSKKIPTSVITAVSVGITALAMLGFAFSGAFWQLCLLAIPYGLGAGAVDAGLNNYVALHYSSRHMSWLHCFWGVGTIISPYIMNFALTGTLGWTGGYKIIGIIQVCLSVLLFATLFVWKKPKEEDGEKSVNMEQKLFKIKGVVYVLIAFFCYCAFEQTTMLWASSYMSLHRGIPAKDVAVLASLFFWGITIGRLICGFITEKIGDKNLIRIGSGIIILGVVLVALPVKWNIFSMVGFVTIGFGCAPIYPSIMHSTPYNFGKENSQKIIGVQMASAYLGTTFAPALFGLIANHITVALLPLYIFALCVIMIITLEILNKIVRKKSNV